MLASCIDESQVEFMDQAQILTDTIDAYIDQKVEQPCNGRGSEESSYQVLHGQALKNFEGINYYLPS